MLQTPAKDASKPTDTDCAEGVLLTSQTDTMLLYQDEEKFLEIFPMEFIQNLIDEAVEDFQISVHREVVDFHVEFIRQMEIQRLQMQQMMDYYSINEELVMEVQRLREENAHLKKTY